MYLGDNNDVPSALSLSSEPSLILQPICPSFSSIHTFCGISTASSIDGYGGICFVSTSFLVESFEDKCLLRFGQTFEDF